MNRGRKTALSRRFNTLLDPTKTRIVAGKCPVHNEPLQITPVYCTCTRRGCRFEIMVWERNELIEDMNRSV